MILAPKPGEEEERLAALHDYHILDTLPEQSYDDITFLASRICEAPIALISLVDGARQWFKSRVGLDAQETSRDLAFCAHAILEPEQLLVVPDAARDERFAKNPLVKGEPHIRFYAGAPLRTSKGHALGTLCVIDRKPREIADGQKNALAALSRQVMVQLDLRVALVEMERQASDLGRYRDKLEKYQVKLESANARLEVKSRTDALTGLANRAAFEPRLEEEVYRATRYEYPLALLLMDLDRFKTINDEFGHPAGDALLKRVGHVLRDTSRVCDFVARYGGEEFAVLLPNTGKEGASIMAERFRRTIETTPWTPRPVTMSVGVAVVTGPKMTSQELLAEADRRLYEAKAEGRNRVAAGPD